MARLYSDGGFRRQLAEQFEGDYRLHFHLAPPWLAKRNPHTGLPEKRRLPEWTLGAFGLLARLKWLRGSPLDPFGRSGERRTERALITEYREAIESLLPHVGRENYDRAVAIASLPESVRGFGHVKMAAVGPYQQELEDLVRRFREPSLAVVVNQ